jgi:hypothetical protein
MLMKIMGAVICLSIVAVTPSQARDPLVASGAPSGQERDKTNAGLNHGSPPFPLWSIYCMLFFLRVPAWASMSYKRHYNKFSEVFEKSNSQL